MDEESELGAGRLDDERTGGECTVRKSVLCLR